MQNSTPSKPRLGWQIYIITVLFSCLSYFTQTAPIDTADYFETAFRLSHTEFVYLASLFFIPYSIMQVPGGILFDNYGLKYILAPAILCSTIGVYLYWFSPNPLVLGIGRCIAGFGCSVAYVASVYAAVRFFNSSRLAILISILELISTLGSLLAANPLKASLGYLGWNNTGIIVISLFMLLFIYSCMVSKKLPVEKITKIRLNEILLKVLGLLRNKALLYIFAYSFLVWLVIMSFAGYWLHAYLQNMHHYSESYALTLVEVYWGSFLVSSFVIGYFTKGNKSARFNLLLVASIGFITFSLMAIPVLFNSFEVILIVIFGGVSASGIIIAFTLVPRFVAPELRATAVALNNTFVVLGGYCGQIIFGWLVSNFNLDSYVDIIHDNSIEPYHYSALMLYVVATGLSLVFAFLITRQIGKSRH